MSSVIFVLLDGLSAQSSSCMGYMAALTENSLAVHTVFPCELPPLSRPLYATYLSGLCPVQHGVVTNNDNRCLTVPHIFSRACRAGLKTAAAAYYWVSELCNRSPYIPVRDRITSSEELSIQNGIFYSCDEYPDSHLFLDAESLRTRFVPDFLLVHSMGIDNAGHLFGGDSPQYRNAVRQADFLLAEYIPNWLEAGYTILVASDHGMHPDAAHNDDVPIVRNVPFWVAGPVPSHIQLPNCQKDCFSFICSLLNI